MQPDSVSGETHRWMVDSLEEGVASIEVDGRQMVPLPRWIIPKNAREGDVLSVTHAAGGDESTLVIRLDADATKAAMDRSRAQVRQPGAKRDPGGDIRL